MNRLHRIFVSAALLFLPLAAAAQEPSDDSFRGFVQTRTEHFTIVYEPRDSAAADAVAGFAEDVYANLTQFLRSHPARIVVLLNGRTDAANGLFTPLPPRHIEINVASPALPWLGARGEGWLKLVFVHELAHYIHLEYDFGFFHVLSVVFGPLAAGTPGGFLPGWFVEGMGVEAETYFTEGGRGRNPFFEIYYRAYLMEGTLFPFQYAAYGSQMPPRNRIYVSGYLLLDYLVRHYGPDTVAAIVRDFSAWPFFGIKGPIRRATGKRLPVIFDDVNRELAIRYAAVRSERGEKLTADRVANYYAARQTNRGIYAYRSAPDKPSAIVNVSDNDRTVVRATLSDGSSFAADAEGSKIVFASFVADLAHPAGSEETSELYLATAARVDPVTDTSASSGTADYTVRRLTYGGHLVQPAISADGTRLVALKRSGSRRILVTVDLENGTTNPIYVPESGATISTPAFSPDGSRIALSENAGGTERIRIIEWGGANDTPRTLYAPAGFQAHYPRFVTNDELLLTVDDGDGLSIYAQSLADGRAALVVSDPVGAYDAFPANDRIVYVSFTSDGFALFSKPAAQPLDSANDASSLRTTFEPGATEVSDVSPASEPEVAPEDSNAPSAPAERQPYADLAWPALWLPTAELSENGSNDTILGLGVYSLGASLLGRWSWEADLGVFPDPLQPFGTIDVTYRYGMFGAAYTMNQDYYSSPDETGIPVPRQVTEQSLRLAVSPVALYERSASRILTFGIALSNLIGVYGYGDFTFADAFSRPGLSSFFQLSAGAFVSYSRDPAGFPWQIFPPWQLSVSGGASAGIPVAGSSFNGVHAETEASLSLPFFSPYQVLRPTVGVSYDTGNHPSTRPFDPPGFDRLSWTGLGSDNRGMAHATLSWEFTIARTDIPLPFYLGLVGFGGRLFVDAAAGWDFRDPSGALAGPTVVPDRALTTGAVLTTLIARGNATVPVSIGLSVRVTPGRLPRIPQDFGLILDASLSGLFD